MENRGNKLFTGHRFILPEFVKRLLETTEEVPVKPHLNEEAQAEIEQRIRDALATGDLVRLMVYTDQGLEDKVGVIKAVSMTTREIKVEIAGGKIWVKLEDVMGVTEGYQEF
ncbi:MAG: YolD-like family protein [Bacillota bacterium]